MSDFLKRPIFSLNGFQVTVFTVILIAAAFMVYRAYVRR